ncbi:TY-Chap domain-containing protein [Nocardioides sp. JS614]|uniref:TY-Chap domain-containing protein n=2 Tax=unclassified Nocardioides TaxID=2615069 RepID=UPI0000EB63C0|nr:hypothetical protein [Nocardioides sp. JS614]ABL83659.1 hypothetical protein Noca_4162 [Nocardioides sp. JS614]
MATTWADVTARLDQELAGLGDGEFLVVGEPAAEPGPPRGLLRRRAPAPPRRYVQVRVAGAWGYAECVGATRFGGEWPATPAQHDALRALGWLAPGDADPTGTAPAYPNYWRTVPVAELPALASLGARSLEVLGTDPAAVRVDRARA